MPVLIIHRPVMQSCKRQKPRPLVFLLLPWLNQLNLPQRGWMIHCSFHRYCKGHGFSCEPRFKLLLKKGQLYFQYIFSPAVIHLPRYMSFFKVWEIQLLIKKKNTVVRMCNLIVKYQVKLISIQYKCHDSGCKILVVTVTEHLLVQGIDFKDSSLRLLIKEKPRALSVPCCCVY